MFHQQRSNRSGSISTQPRSLFPKKQLGLAVALATTAFSAHAQIEEVLVTATKRTESMQDIPVAVSALGEEALDQLGISNFEDYLT